MPHYVVLLLVTWLSGQAGSSYQVQFSEIDLCHTAQRFLQEEAQRLNAQPNQPHVTLSAVCVDQQKDH